MASTSAVNAVVRRIIKSPFPFILIALLDSQEIQTHFYCTAELLFVSSSVMLFSLSNSVHISRK